MNDPKTKSLFKDNKLLVNEIKRFLNRHGGFFISKIDKTSYYFELSVYNNLVEYYENHGWDVVPRNFGDDGKQFVYAVNPAASPIKCSYFSLRKTYTYPKTTIHHDFELRHNLRIQSKHNDRIFITPDFAVIRPDSIENCFLKYYFNGKVAYHFCKSDNVITFAEAKNYMPSPELIINYVGILNEINPGFIFGEFPSNKPFHFSPSLVISGASNPHTTRISHSLSERYKINVFMSMFYFPQQIYSKKYSNAIRRIGSN